MGELHCTDSTRPAASTSFCQPSFFIYDFSNSISPFFIADKRRRNATVCNVSTAPESDAEPHRDAGCSRASPHNQLPEVTVRRQTFPPGTSTSPGPSSSHTTGPLPPPGRRGGTSGGPRHRLSLPFSRRRQRGRGQERAATGHQKKPRRSVLSVLSCALCP